MKLSAFVHQVPNFDQLQPREKMRLFAWHLHTHRGTDTFDNADMRDCFQEINAKPPDVTVYLPRMADANELVRVKGGYKLEGSIRRAFDVKYGAQPRTVAISKMLSDLPGKITNAAERTFLDEALKCYRVEAYRATIVMTWNLAFDHLLTWIMADAARLAAFNTASPVRFAKKPPPPIVKREDFEETKEADIVEVCRTAKLLSKNQADIMRDKLRARNRAAHPSQIIIVQAQADDVVTDLVNNIVLALNQGARRNP